MDIFNKIKGLDTKVKVLGAVALVLVFIIIIMLVSNSSTNSNNDNYNDNYYQEDNFGNNEDVTAVQKEDVVATTPDIEVVILSKKFGGGIDGYVEVTKASASVNERGEVLLSVEGIKGGPGDQKSDGSYWYGNPYIKYRVYDANGTLLSDGALKVDNYENKEQGDICKGVDNTHIEAEKVARIEIG